MSQNDLPKDGTPAPASGELDAAQVEGIAGGAGDCTTTLTAGTSGINVGTAGGSVAEVLTNTYEGAVSATSYVIERVANALK